MKRIKKITQIVFLFAFVAMLLTGCGKKEEYNKYIIPEGIFFQGETDDTARQSRISAVEASCKSVKVNSEGNVEMQLDDEQLEAARQNCDDTLFAIAEIFAEQKILYRFDANYNMLILTYPMDQDIKETNIWNVVCSLLELMMYRDIFYDIPQDEIKITLSVYYPSGENNEYIYTIKDAPIPR